MKLIFAAAGLFLFTGAFFVSQYGKPVWEKVFEHKKWYEIEAEVNTYSKTSKIFFL